MDRQCSSCGGFCKKSGCERENVAGDCCGYASRLATHIWEKHYKDSSPDWKPLDTLIGVLTQIDNMTSGLTRMRQPAQQEPVAWRNAAIRVGEDLCSVGPFGYYDMTAEQWLNWALGVVTVHAPPQALAESPKREWVGLTDEEFNEHARWADEHGGTFYIAYARSIEAKLKEKNT